MSSTTKTVIVKAFDAGVDDYITKPFSPKVLLARMRAVLRRRETAAVGEEGAEADALRVGQLIVDRRRCEVRLGGAPVDLSRTEFRILELLAQRPGWVFSRTQIIRAIHGHEAVVTHRAVDVQIVGLRRKLGPAGPCIETVRGFGYRLAPHQQRPTAPPETNETLTESPQPANGGGL